ncbi:MAG: glycosyltransferase family 2 protein [Chloroflexota bacterium]|nr:MAG: glycosyltransferase family 2 protein [Chloroflexota bacterium]
MSRQSGLPLVSVLIVAYNGQDYLGRCLDSLAQSDYPCFETIVVDNASTDSSVAVATQHHLRPTVVRSAENLGFAGGNNLGLREAKGEIIVLLNQDAHVRPDWLSCLIDGMLEDPRIGIAGCKLFDPDERTIQHAGGVVHPNALTNHLGAGEADAGQHDGIRDVDYVTGAALAIRRDVIESCGALDTGYFPAYFEELDLCQRVRRAGFRVVYIPRSVAVHHESSSTQKFSPSFFYFYHKNRLRFVLKNYSIGQIVGGFLPHELRWLLGHCPPNQVRPLARAYLHNAVFLPRTLICRWKRQ